MKALVTGATGFIGAHLTKRLIKEGLDTSIFCRENSNFWRVADILPKIKRYKADLTDYEKLLLIVKKINPDYVFHLAAAGLHAGVSSSEKDLYQANFLGTINLINACENINYKLFVNTGSSSEYGLKIKSMKESDICHPNTFYGVTKLGGTLYGQMIAFTKNKPIVTLRVFSPFGPLDDRRRLIPQVINNALQNKNLILSHPKVARDYIYIDDLINLYMEIIKPIYTHSIKGEVFNAGAGKQRTINEVVKNILKITDSKSKPLWNAFSNVSYDTEKWEADMSKTFKFFRWRPKYTLTEGLKRTIDYCLEM